MMIGEDILNFREGGGLTMLPGVESTDYWAGHHLRGGHLERVRDAVPDGTGCVRQKE